MSLLAWALHKNIVTFFRWAVPAEAIELKYSRIEEEFFKSRRGNDWAIPEIFAREHAMIWEHYGQHFFDLFDLNYPDLWEEYGAYLKEYYEIVSEKNKMLKAIFNGERYPFLHNVC